jgi:hypothetical protein
VLLVHTYSAPPRANDPPGQGPLKERHLLRPDEVPALLPEAGWDFLHRSQAFDEPGKAMIGFVARRRASVPG